MTNPGTSYSFTLTPGENIIDVVKGLNLSIGGAMKWDYAPFTIAARNGEGILTLTTFRLVATFPSEAGSSHFSCKGILGYMEDSPMHIRCLLGGKYPYKVKLVLPGGLSLVVETYHRSPDLQEFLEAAEPVSRFLAKSFFLLGEQNGNEIGEAAIIGYEEKKKQE